MKFIPKFTNSVDQVPKAAGSMIFDINKKSLNFDYKASDSGEITRYELKGGSGGSGSGLPDFSEQEAGSIIKVVDNESSAVLKTPFKVGDTASNFYMLRKEVEEYDISTLDWEASSVVKLYRDDEDPKETGKMIPAIEFDLISEDELVICNCLVGWAKYSDYNNCRTLALAFKDGDLGEYWYSEIYFCAYLYDSILGINGWLSDIDEFYFAPEGKYLEKLILVEMLAPKSIKIKSISLANNQIFTGSKEVEVIPPEEAKSAIWTPLFNANKKDQVLKAVSGKFYEPFLLKYVASGSGYENDICDDELEKIYFNTEKALDFSKDINYLDLVQDGKVLPPITEEEVNYSYYVPFGYFYTKYNLSKLYCINAGYDYSDTESKLNLLWITSYLVSYSEDSTTSFTIENQLPVYTSSDSYTFSYYDILSKSQTSVSFGNSGWVMDSWTPLTDNSDNDKNDKEGSDLICTTNEYYSHRHLFSVLYGNVGKSNDLQPLGAYISKNGIFVGGETQVTYKWVDKNNISNLGSVYYRENGPDYFGYVSSTSTDTLYYTFSGIITGGLGLFLYSIDTLFIKYEINGSNYSFSYNLSGILMHDGKDTKIVTTGTRGQQDIFLLTISNNNNAIEVKVTALTPNITIKSINSGRIWGPVCPMGINVLNHYSDNSRV